MHLVLRHERVWVWVSNDGPCHTRGSHIRARAPGCTVLCNVHSPLRVAMHAHTQVHTYRCSQNTTLSSPGLWTHNLHSPANGAFTLQCQGL